MTASLLAPNGNMEVPATTKVPLMKSLLVISLMVLPDRPFLFGIPGANRDSDGNDSGSMWAGDQTPRLVPRLTSVTRC